MSLSEPRAETPVVKSVNGGLGAEVRLFRQELLQAVLRSEDGETFVQFYEVHHDVLFPDFAEVEQQFAAVFRVFHLPECCDQGFQFSHFL